MIDGTPTPFERVKVEVDGIDVLVTHKSIDTQVKLNGKVYTDSTGWPRGHETGDYEGTTKIELASQEGLQHLQTLAQEASEPITMTRTHQPVEGDGGAETLFLRLDELSLMSKKSEEEMLTLNFLHSDVMQIDGDYIIEDRRSDGGSSGGGGGVGRVR